MKFDAKTNPSCTIAGRQRRRVVEHGQQTVLLGRESEVLPPDAEIQRQVRRDLPVLGDERVHVGHPVSARGLAEGERRVGDLARAVAVRRVPVADGQEVEPAPEVVPAVLSFPQVAVEMVAPQLAAGPDRVASLA